MCWDRRWITILSIAQFLLPGHCQQSDNTPPTMWLERNWQIPETEPVGSKIAQVHGSDAEGGNLEYGLEPMQFYGSKEPSKPLPFRIDPKGGAVYLNQSLEGRAGQNLHLYVTVFDGELTAKTEVYVNILANSSQIKTSSSQNRPPFPVNHSGIMRHPGFLNYPELNSRPISPNLPSINKNNSNYPPVSITHNMTEKPWYFQEKTYPEIRPISKKNKVTSMKPVETEANDFDNTISDKTEEPSKSVRSTISAGEEVHKNSVGSSQSTLKTPQEFSSTMIPILAICAIFVTVGFIAAIFRKKIYFGKNKDSKDNMRKQSSSGAVVSREDPGLNLHEWAGPRAFSNRYEHWQTEGNHPQAATQLSDTVKIFDRWEFPRHRLKFFNILGEGAFGQVWKCEAVDLEGKDTGPTTVAVKTLKENATEKERSDLVSELCVMKMLEPHPNVVRLLGCCTDKEPVFLIMEYISRGKLQSYLRNSRAERCYNNMHGPSRSLTSRDLTSFCYQVAKGMEFLSSNGIIHRDLAARNILITDDHTCKVADFGFARDVVVSHVYERKSEGRLPIRWMAPESLYDNIFSTKSDVWSFGIFVWEVVTLGSTPYPGMSAQEVMKKVRDGYRLDKPEHCRRELYNIMYYCWDKNPKDRPPFTECVTLLENLLMTETDYIELERFPDHSYYNMISLSGEKL